MVRLWEIPITRHRCHPWASPGFPARFLLGRMIRCGNGFPRSSPVPGSHRQSYFVHMLCTYVGENVMQIHANVARSTPDGSTGRRTRTKWYVRHSITHVLENFTRGPRRGWIRHTLYFPLKPASSCFYLWACSLNSREGYSCRIFRECVGVCVKPTLVVQTRTWRSFECTRAKLEIQVDHSTLRNSA